MNAPDRRVAPCVGVGAPARDQSREQTVLSLNACHSHHRPHAWSGSAGCLSQRNCRWWPDEVVGEIGAGRVLVGVTHDDTVAQAHKLAEKIWHLRILDDAEGVMNRSVADTGERCW